jgi:hypothetical protein
VSSKRAIRRKACEGKTRYTSFSEAASALRGFLRQFTAGGWPMSAYRCKFCSGFHFGHVPAEALAARKQARGAAR